LRILSIEDDPKDTELIQDLLETEDIVCEVTRVDSQAALEASLEQGGIDLILADYTLPTFDGLSALKLAMKPARSAFLLVSGTLGEEVAIEALKIGATDYVVKTRLSRLVPVGGRRAYVKPEKERNASKQMRSCDEVKRTWRSAATEPDRQLRLHTVPQARCSGRRNLSNLCIRRNPLDPRWNAFSNGSTRKTNL